MDARDMIEDSSKIRRLDTLSHPVGPINAKPSLLALLYGVLLKLWVQYLLEQTVGCDRLYVAFQICRIRELDRHLKWRYCTYLRPSRPRQHCRCTY